MREGATKVEERYLSIGQAAGLLGLHPDSIRRAIRLGYIGVVQLGPKTALRIPKSEITKRLRPWPERAG
jgi:excisionase family DNA binding protein